MLKHYFLYDGIDSRDYDVWLNAGKTEASAERDLSFVSVPGRSGDLIVDNGRYKNINVSYSGSIVQDFSRSFGALRAALLAHPGYHRLEDSVNPEYYRMAAFSGPIDPETTPYNLAGEFELAFHAKPQRRLKSGDCPVMLTGEGLLYNPTQFDALPIVKVYGSGAGQLQIGAISVSFVEIEEWVVLDCETQNAYRGVANKNNTISAPEFPVLKPGSNAINWTGSITGVEITPRWWTL